MAVLLLSLVVKVGVGVVDDPFSIFFFYRRDNMKQKCMMVIIYDDMKTTPSRLLHVVGDGEGVVSCRVEKLEG